MKATLARFLSFLLFTAATIPSQAQTFKVMYNFGQGQQVSFGETRSQGRDGNLYLGGSYKDGLSVAAIQITPAGTFTTYRDSAEDSGGFANGFTLGTDGSLYGTSSLSYYGSVFKFTPSSRTFTVLYNFTGGDDGGDPGPPPVQGRDGNFYGTTTYYGSGGWGTVYKLTPAGELTTLFSFDSSNGYSGVPLVRGTDGNFYGTTSGDTTSKHNLGSVFKITPEGKMTFLYIFDGAHGANPQGPLVQGANGNFYGTAAGGGAQDAGTVFEITPTGHLTVLYSMNGTTDGASPVSTLVAASDGNFYGLNKVNGRGDGACQGGCGTLFKITPAGDFTVLHDFGSLDGSEPVALLQLTNGVLYGMTVRLGVHGNGTFFSYSDSDNLPAFVSLLPAVGKVGKVVEILGQGFTGTTGVSFGGVAATTFDVISATYMTATVPEGAKTGTVSVETPSGTLNSNQSFIVTP
jgi:uncharacterized repeat protein (TIGR03803 family)